MSHLENKHATERATDSTLADRGLPEVAFIDNSDKQHGPSPVIGVRRGEAGYYPIFTPLSADELNAERNVTSAQREAMYNGSLFGWDTPSADPSHPLVIKSAAIRDQKRSDITDGVTTHG